MLTRLLIDLDSTKAVVLFLISLAVASFSIAFDRFVPHIPIAVVLAYGCCLIAASYRYLNQLSEMTKNSPYFLAFLLFLVALYSLFSSARVELPREVILAKLGAAILPTVIGLSIRQILFAIDPAQRDHDVFYRSLEEELKRSAVEFRKAQVQLVDLVKDFTSKRTVLLDVEAQVADSYVNHLKGAVAVFEDTASSYPRAIRNALVAFEAKLADLMQKLESSVDRVKAIDTTAMTSVSEQFTRLAVQLEAVTQMLGGVGKVTQSLTSDLSVFESRVAEVTSGATNAIVKSGDVFTNEIATTLPRYRELLEREHVALRATIQPIRDDLRAIDQILTDFVAVLEKRIEATASDVTG